MEPLDVAHRYFDAWNRRDPAAVLDILGTDGTYQDPGTAGPVSGEALTAYMTGLFSAFPDLSFEIVSVGLAAPDLVAAQWIMRGTNTGSMLGLPPTGRSVELPGADFIRVAGDKVRSVEGYFDSRGVPEQLGLQVIVQPKAIGPFGFGNSFRAWAGATQKPGAVSVTMLRARGPEAIDRVRAQSRQIATELLTTKGFLGLVTATVGDRMMTITAWEDAEAPRFPIPCRSGSRRPGATASVCVTPCGTVCRSANRLDPRTSAFAADQPALPIHSPRFAPDIRSHTASGETAAGI